MASPLKTSIAVGRYWSSGRRGCGAVRARLGLPGGDEAHGEVGIAVAERSAPLAVALGAAVEVHRKHTAAQLARAKEVAVAIVLEIRRPPPPETEHLRVAREEDARYTLAYRHR